MSNGLPQTSAEPPPAQPGLLRALGLGAATAVVVGNVIGSGIFFKPGKIAADAGDFGLIMLAWVFGGVLCVLGALCLAEPAAMLPRAGGLYVYLKEAYGKPTAFLFGWNEFLFEKPGSIGALAVACVGMFLLSWEQHPGVVWEATCAIGLIAALTWVNVLGVVWGGRLQSATTLIKAGGVALIAVAPFVWMLHTPDVVNLANYRSTLSHPPVDQAPLAARFGLILLAIMWAYNGWHGIGPVAEEIRQPERNIPRALFVGIGILIVLYVAANVAYHGVLSMDEMAAAGDHAAVEMARRLAGESGAALIAAIVMCSTFGAINSNLLLGPRVSFAMGRDDLLFRRLGRVHPRYRTPATAIVMQGAMSAALVAVAMLLKGAWAGTDLSAWSPGVARRVAETIQRDSIFTLLTNFVIFAASIFYFLGGLAVIVLRRKFPEMHRPYRTWGYPVTPLLFLAAYAWFLWQVYWEKPFEAHAGLLMIALGLPAYAAWQRWGRQRTPEAPAA